MTLLNSIGQKVFEQKITEGTNTINTNALAKGLYNCILLRDKIKIGNNKMVVE